MSVLLNKIIWITGAGSGIGLELVRQLNHSSNKIVLSGRRISVLNEVKQGLKFPENTLVLPLDLAEPQNFTKAVEQVYTAFGRLDIMVHNAGISQRSTIIQTDEAVDRQLMEVNYFGTTALTKAILPKFLKQGGGQFVVISSLSGKFGYTQRAAYSASKHALHGFFETLSIELGQQAISVTMVCPGPVQTNIDKHALDGSGKAMGVADAMQTHGTPVDVAVQKIIKGIAAQNNEVIIGGAKAYSAIWIHKLFPGLFTKMVRRIKS